MATKGRTSSPMWESGKEKGAWYALLATYLRSRFCAYMAVHGDWLVILRLLSDSTKAPLEVVSSTKS